MVLDLTAFEEAPLDECFPPPLQVPSEPPKNPKALFSPSLLLGLGIYFGFPI